LTAAAQLPHASGKRIIHATNDHPVDINKAFPTEASLLRDAKLVLEALITPACSPFAMSGRSTHLAPMPANWDYASAKHANSLTASCISQTANPDISVLERLNRYEAALCVKVCRRHRTFRPDYHQRSRSSGQIALLHNDMFIRPRLSGELQVAKLLTEQHLALRARVPVRGACC
jgi:hypothetical protein